MTTPGSGSATSTPEYDDNDLQMAAAVISQTLEEPVVSIATLTDEELMAIEGIQHRQLSPLPWSEANLRTDEERAVATATATRGLVARGLVRMKNIKDPMRPGEPGPDNEIAPALRGTIVARRTADHVVVAERQTTEGKGTSLFYVFELDGGRRVLWELYGDQGLHDFFVMDGETLAAQLLLFADPVGGVGEEDGEPVEIPAAQFQTHAKSAELKEARAVTSIALRSRGEGSPALFTLFSQLDRLELMETEGEGEAAVARIATISRGGVEQLIASLLGTEADGSGTAS